MSWSLVKTIIILPGTVIVFVPAAILWATGDTPRLISPAKPAFWISLVLAVGAIAMAIWTVRLFAGRGQGTPAPWDPPRKLVVDGPYRHVRNPMITSVLSMLAAQALIFQSSAIATWLLLFFVANAVYFPLSEEKGLERRFGEDYRLYKANVPRWIPRLTPWSQPIDDDV